LRALLKLAVAAAIVVSTYYAILGIAERKADALAGGDAFVLDRRHAPEMARFASLVERLRGWGETELAASLTALREDGRLWVAPHLSGGRSAITVSALGLVSRIYVSADQLAGTLPFPELDVPEAAQREFAAIRLAGTLFHELQHHQGLLDEAATYEREVEWYRGLREANAAGRDGEERRWFAWRVDSALQSAQAAREKASGTPTP
jgi:hypothetical protein